MFTRSNIVEPQQRKEIIRNMYNRYKCRYVNGGPALYILVRFMMTISQRSPDWLSAEETNGRKAIESGYIETGIRPYT